MISALRSDLGLTRDFARSRCPLTRFQAMDGATVESRAYLDHSGRSNVLAARPKRSRHARPPGRVDTRSAHGSEPLSSAPLSACPRLGIREAAFQRRVHSSRRSRTGSCRTFRDPGELAACSFHTCSSDTPRPLSGGWYWRPVCRRPVEIDENQKLRNSFPYQEPKRVRPQPKMIAIPPGSKLI